MSSDKSPPMDVDAMSSEDSDDVPDLEEVQEPIEIDDSDEDEAAPAEEEIDPETQERLNHENAVALKEAGNALYKRNKYDAAIDKYSEALELEPKEADLLLALLGNRAACAIMIEHYQRGLADCERALKVDPKYVKGFLRGGKCHMRMGDLAAAKEYFNQAKVYEPTNVQVKGELTTLTATEKDYARAKAFIEAGEFKKAVPLLDKVLAECSGSVAIKIERARALLGSKRYTEASSQALAVLRSNQNHADALTIRGEALYYSSTDMEQPLKHFRQALQCDPDNAHAKKLFKQTKELERIKSEGNAAFKCGKCQVAVDLYMEAVQLVPEHTLMVATLYSNMAAAHMKQRKWSEALEECNHALKSMPKNPKALLRRAQCLTELEQYQEAVHDYETLTQIDEGNNEYHQMLRKAKHELKKSQRKNYYKILGVSKDAGDSDIKRAFKKAAIKCHPDKVPPEEREEAEKRFKDLNEAHEILTDSRKRHRYDSGADMMEDDGGGFRGGGFGGMDMDDLMGQFFGGRGGGMGGNRSGGFRF